MHQIDAVSVKIYGPEKSLADAFKYRNKIGLNVALEAPRFFGNSQPSMQTNGCAIGYQSTIGLQTQMPGRRGSR